jgi:hypothetical protein
MTLKTTPYRALAYIKTDDELRQYVQMHVDAAMAGAAQPDPGQKWKCGAEFLPFHPQASHVPPDYRDGWNHCYDAAKKQAAQPEPNVKHALGEAVAALYFDDRSDYETALWQIVSGLGGEEATDLLRQDAPAAYHRYAADRNASPATGG